MTNETINLSRIMNLEREEISRFVPRESANFGPKKNLIYHVFLACLVIYFCQRQMIVMKGH